MNTKLTKLIRTAAFAAAIAAGAGAYADGNIYEIVPCTQDGTALSGPISSANSPLVAGETMYFKIRMARTLAMKTAGKQWTIVHHGMSEILDDFWSSLSIGIYVSGKPKYAKYVNYLDSTAEIRDFIFSYTAEPGDFALPIRLAGVGGPAGVDDENAVYQLLNADKWTVEDGAGNPATFQYGTSFEVAVTPSFTYRTMDYSLVGAGFYVRTINFDPAWESDSFWRMVHSGSTVTDSLAPCLVADSAPTNAVTLHVWSMNQDIVTIEGGRTVHMVVGYEGSTPQYEDVQVGDVQFAAGQTEVRFSDCGFKLKGGLAANVGLWTNLVLSAYDGYTFNKSNVRQVDYATVPVQCTEVLPPTLIVECDTATMVAPVHMDGEDYVSTARLTVYLSQPYDAGPIDATVTPSFEDGSAGDWGDYVRFSKTASNLSSLPSGTTPPTVTIPRGSTGRQTIFVYALRSDEHTTGEGHQMKFTPSFNDAAAALVITETQEAGAWISAAKPVVSAPDEISPISGEDFELEVSVADTVADLADATTGYKIWFKTGGPGSRFVELDGDWVMKDGLLVGRDDSTKMPTVNYPSSGEQTSELYVVSPVSKKKSDPVKIAAHVAESRTATVDTLDENGGVYNEGDQATFKVTLSEKNTTGKTIYAFLKASDNAEAAMFSGNPMFVVCDDTDYTKTKGLAINPNQISTASSGSKIKLLDGLSEDAGGLSVTFEVVLCTTSKYSDDASKQISGYDSNYLNLTVFNVEPEIKRIEMNGFESEQSGYQFPSVPKNMWQKFKAVVSDKGTYDLATDFHTKWTISRNGEQKGTKEIVGNPNDDANVYSNNFTMAGEWTVKCQVKDKDMDDWSEATYEVKFTVLDQPTVGITAEEYYLENDARAKITVALSYWDNDYDGSLKVRVGVKEHTPGQANPGILQLDNGYYRETVGDTAYYEVELNSGNYGGFDILIENMDGTDKAQTLGFDISAEVVSTDVLPTIQEAANTYYLKSTVRVGIEDVPPVCVATPEENTNAWVVAAGPATVHTIRWGVGNDVSNDFAYTYALWPKAGIKVTFTGCANPMETNVTEVASGIFTPDFSGMQGEVPVTLTIDTKDGGSKSWTWRFMVESSKFLSTLSTGPSGGINTSALSRRYVMGADTGLGSGHTFVATSSGAFSYADGFQLVWNCNKNLNAQVYAFGYKVSGDPANPTKDDNSLDGGRDVGINVNGDQKADRSLTNYYVYNPADGKDSFFYLWILHQYGDDGSVEDSVVNDAISPEVKGALVYGRIPLPSQKNEDGIYPDTIAEAVFAKEWLKEDNLGDINQDGIPDYFAVKEWKGSGTSLITASTGLDDLSGDLRDIAAHNPDEDKLPGVWRQGGTLSNVGGIGTSYAPVGRDFNNMLELRGFHDGLNDLDKAVSEPSFSDDELFAWTNFVTSAEGVDKGYSTTNDAGEVTWATNIDLRVWCPEPRNGTTRMDPTDEDTDNDGFPDGWEYFFWYQAKVWHPAYDWRTRHPNDVDSKGVKLIVKDTNDAHLYPGQPRAGQTYTFERFNLDDIVNGIEITPAEVMVRFDPCTKFDPETATGYFKDDFDGDGLTDLEELLIGTNPCHWDTDGDHLCDAWEVMMCLDPLNGSKGGNADNDFMAFHSVWEDLCWIDPAAAVTDPEAEGVRIYRIQDKYGVEENKLVYGVDYAQRGDKFVMLTDADVEVCSFTPKFIGPDEARERLIYGRADDRPNSGDWAYGWYMVDDVRRESIHLSNGDELAVELRYAFVHEQVLDAFGFDPRTGWSNIDGYVADRWNPTRGKAEPGEGTGVAVNTRAYAAYDEYLVMKYRLAYAIDYSPNTPVDDGFNPGNETVWAFIRRKTTNPSVAYPSTDSGDGGSSTNATAEAGVAEAVAAAFSQIGSDKAPVTSHGADTDGDGVPDGWELYTYRNPNAAPYLEENGRTNSNRDFDDDDLVYAAEYAGVDACNAYKDCESIYSRHPGNRSGWWNKFLPTNPGTMKVNLNGQRVVYAGQGNDDGADSDGDGIGDGREGSAWHAVFANGGVENAMHQRRATLGFVYGTIEDDMRTVCFRGGGMNPCTVDTDVDGIPDGWEMQHAGVPVRLPDKKVIAPRNGNVYDIELDDATFIADGVYDRAPAGTNTIVYIAGGMDATWGGDASFEDADNGLSYDSLLGTRRDVDFDHDGLQNYQEYLTQATRHFRYDDITTPLMGRQLEEGTYDPAMRLVTLHSQSFGDKTGGTDGTGTGYPVFDSADPETFAANAAEAWNGLTFVEYATITTGVREITKVVDEATGETVTNKIYYTALKKRFIGNAELVAKHVSSGGTGVQQPWTVEGWRALGYFAPPAHDWDRAAARRDSAASAVPQKLYMFPVTGHMAVYDLSSPGWSVAGYATTDPRIADTDDDGMDDYYEMFHGLNPLLGTTPANAGVTAWISYKRGDVISAQYAMAASTPFDTAVMYFNAWYNEWVYPTFNGLLARMGMAPEDAAGAPIQAPQAYDPVLYPWGMGTPLVDADGDGIRNDEERIVANVADPVARHTDPTPLWFTERTTPASYVSQYYVMSPALKRAMGGYWLASAGVNVEPSVLTNVKTDTIRIMYGDPDYVYGFEENEGYDTDGDVTPDTFEVVTMTRPSSDPLRFDDPSRRQALYLPGEESYAMSRDLQERPFEAMDFLKQFTVECWVLPERSGAAQTVVDRCVAYEGDAIGTDKVAIRSNFRIGIDAQDHAYGMFDNNDSIESGLDAPRSCQFVDGGLIKIGEWTHIALTYDGSRLAIYVNGVERSSATTTLVPANGIVMLWQDVSSTNGFQNVGYASAPSTLIVGARPKKENVYALYPYYIDAQGMHKESFDNLQEYFKGYIDELRVWDGARTAEQIAANFRRSIGYDEAKANRDEVFESWYLNGGTRNNNDGRPNLPAELALNFDFSSIAGAAEPGDVAKTPAGFVDNVVVAALSDYASNPDIDTTGLYDNIGELKGDATIDDYMLVGWWNDSLVHSTVYDDYHVVPWIKDTVSHLPRLDGGSPDSFVYGDFFGAQYTPVAAFELDKFTFPNTAVPYSSVLYGRDNYYRIAYALRLYDERGQAYRSNFAKCRFQAKSTFSASADLVPLGGAYAKTCPAMWDGSPADPWEQTGDDTNGDGLPDWWEEYARHNYSPDVEPGAPVLWSTTVTRYFGGYGVEMPAGKAYVIDLYRGLQPDGTIDPAYAVSADDDGDGLPDWWQRLYGVAGLDPDEDPDNDGLSIYQEWLVSWGEEYGLGLSNGYPLLDPMRARTASGQKETDYFLRAVVDPYEGYYLGEIVADFDMMEDLVENDLGTDNTLFDAWSDYDEDGWTAWAELRYSTFKASQASRFLSHYAGDDEVADSPVPVVRATLRYNGVPPASASNRTVYVQAYAGNNMLKSPSATYVARPGTSETRQFYLGMPEDRVVHGTLAPGFVQSIEGAVRLQYAFVQPADSYSWRVAGEEMTHTGSYADLRAAIIQHGADLEVAALAYDWNDVSGGFTATDGTRDALTVGVDDATQRGYLLLDLERVGEIDFMTGDFTFDLSKIAGHTFTDSAIAADNCFFRIVYSVKLPTLQTGSLSLSLAKPDSGALTEGTAAFTAFIDFDGDGAYTPDTDPFGFVKDVEVGWDRVPEIVIEMTDDSAAAGKRIAYPEDAGVVRIIRTAINGEETIDGEDVKRRIVYSRDASTTARTDINEADLVTGGKFGLDWTNLRSDVEAMAGISIRNVSSVTYTVAKGGGSVLNIDPTNVLETFTVNFPAEQVKPSAVSPSEYSGPIVETQRPTFKWMGAADNTAFVLQILDAATNAVYTSDMQVLPARDSSGAYAWKAPVYIGTNVCGEAWSLDNGSNYLWRVAMFSQKFSNTNLEAAAWSDFAAFDTALAPVGARSTLYGAADVTVRYFGPATNGLEDVVVQLYSTADFTGAPAAQSRLFDIDGTVESLTNDAYTVRFLGLEPGDYYAVAYIDRSGDLRRQRFESWGYANQIGTGSSALYTPKALRVVAKGTSAPSVEVFVEDTDINKNDVPDCLDDEALFKSASSSGGDDSDVDGDGLTADEEAGDTYTDPSLWDSDGDGMPDGWEARFAGTDPLFADADTVVAGDVMAYAEETWKLVTDAAGVFYLLNPTNETVHVGDDLPLARLVATYDYAGKYGVGTNLVDDAAVFRVAKVESVTAVLVHSQVYDAYRFSQLTANPAAYAAGESVNTKPFTAIDKYLLVRHFEALGICTEADVNAGRAWAQYSLLPSDPDNDRDGVADGWELYVMFGTEGVTNVIADAKVSPFNYDDARADAPDNGGLTVLDEYDGGHFPTDPWAVDTDRDGIPDNLAFKYHTKGSDGREDFDGDGLSNYVEYMLAEKFHVAEFDPDNAFSVNPYLSDYFFRLTDVYVGEVFTDNDQVGDQWESLYLPESGGFVSPYAYDADNDADFDGWSNYAEFRAGTDPTRIQSQETVVKADDEGKEATSTVNKAQYPVPTVELKVTYLGTQNIGGAPLVVQAWSDKTMQTIPDAVWTVGGESDGKTGGDADSGDGQASSNVVGLAVSTYYLTESDQRTSSLNTSGHLREGSNLFVAFYDRDGDGAYTPGEPYGMVRDVDVGWSSAKASVELTDTTPVIPRYKLTEGGASSGGSGVQAAGGTDATDREALWEATLTDVYTVTGSVIAASEKSHVRVRVVRFAIDGLSSCLPTNYMAVVFDRVLDLTGDGRPSLTEADILSDPRNEFDIDWKANALSSSVRTLQQTYTAYSSMCAFTNMLYAVYTGDGSVVPGDYTNKAVLAKILKRKFGRVREYPSPELVPEGVKTSPAPTFRWRMVPSGSGLSTYTAFRVRVKNSSGTVVWTSPMKLMPPRDAEGYYSWTPPIRVGCVFPGTATLFENGKMYQWEISTYNALYNTVSNDDWIGGGSFTMNVPESAPDYGTAKVAVRYFGPKSVLAKLAGKIIVQAFTTPDFSGEPVAAGYVTDMSKVDDSGEITEANARIIGLTQGTYYLLAFIDTQNDGVRSSIVNEAGRASRWESWGCYCVRDEKGGAIFTPKPVVVGPYVGGGDVIPIYIEDCDVEGDRLPDAWEWAENGKLTQWGVKQKIDKVLAGFAMNSALTGLQNVDDGMPAGLEVAMSSLGSPRLAALMLGADATGSDDEVLSSLDSVKKVEPVSVAITGIEIDGATGSVTIRTSTEVAPSDSPALAFFELDGAEALTLDCQVWRADSLDGEWSRFGEPAKVTIGTEASEITVDVGDGLRAAGGFFKVTLEK